MGYIMPITHYQYAEYQKRVVTDKRDVMHIDQPFKVVLEKQYETMDATKPFKAETEKKDTIQRQKHNQLTMKPNAQAYALMTGKGRLFSETV